MNEEWKADAWSNAAMQLEATAQDILSEDCLTEDNTRCWKYVLEVVVPSLDRKARSIRKKSVTK